MSISTHENVNLKKNLDIIKLISQGRYYASVIFP